MTQAALDEPLLQANTSKTEPSKANQTSLHTYSVMLRGIQLRYTGFATRHPHLAPPCGRRSLRVSAMVNVNDAVKARELLRDLMVRTHCEPILVRLAWCAWPIWST